MSSMIARDVVLRATTGRNAALPRAQPAAIGFPIAAAYSSWLVRQPPPHAQQQQQQRSFIRQPAMRSPPRGVTCCFCATRACRRRRAPPRRRRPRLTTTPPHHPKKIQGRLRQLYRRAMQLEVEFFGDPSTSLSE